MELICSKHIYVKEQSNEWNVHVKWKYLGFRCVLLYSEWEEQTGRGVWAERWMRWKKAEQKSFQMRQLATMPTNRRQWLLNDVSAQTMQPCRWMS